MAHLTLPSLYISETQKISTPHERYDQSLKNTPKIQVIRPENLSAKKPLKPVVTRTNRNLSISILDPNDKNDKLNLSLKPSLPSSMKINSSSSNRNRKNRSEEKQKDISNRAGSWKRNMDKRTFAKAEEKTEGSELDIPLTITKYGNWGYMKEYLDEQRKRLVERENKDQVAEIRRAEFEFSSRVIAAKREQKKREYIESEERKKQETLESESRPTISDLPRTEETLFFTTLEDYVNDKKNSLPIIERVYAHDTEPVEEENVPSIPKRGRMRNHTNLWLERTNHINQEIKDYTSKANKAIKLINFSQEKVEDQARRIEMRYNKLSQQDEVKEPELNAVHRMEALRDAQDWNSKVFSIFKSASTRSKRSNGENKTVKKDRQQFFHMLISRQQKVADQALAQAMDRKQRSRNIRDGERNLFTELSGSPKRF